MLKRKKNKGKDSGGGGGGKKDLLPGGIDPESPEARRVNNVEEIKFEDLKLYFLVIKIRKGIDLKAADMTLKGGNSDPFVEVIANKQKFTTKVIMESLNPEWNEETTFCFFNLVNEIEFKVWDWDKGTKHDSIGNCFLNTSNFFDKNNNGFDGNLKLLNVKKGEINVSVTGKLIVPKELEIRCQTLNEMKIKQNNTINNLDNELNNLNNSKNELLNIKESNTNELNRLNENEINLNNEKNDIINNIEEIETNIEKIKSEIKEIETNTNETINKSDKLNLEKEEINSQLANEETRKNEILENLEKLRNGALGKRLSNLGKGFGKGFATIGKNIISDNDNNNNNTNTSAGTSAGTSTKTELKHSRTTSIDPEAGHMNVGWIRHNAPRESIVNYMESNEIKPQSSESPENGDSTQSENKPFVK